MSYARVLVETYITQQLPMEMYIEKPNDIVVTQAINYEWTPQFCHECMKLGHKNKKYNTEKQPQTAKR